MRDDEDRTGEVGQVLAQGAADVEPGPGVERRERLVEEEERRVRGKGPGEGDPLRLPAGQLGGPALGQVGEVEPVDPVLRRTA